MLIFASLSGFAGGMARLTRRRRPLGGHARRWLVGLLGVAAMIMVRYVRLRPRAELPPPPVRDAMAWAAPRVVLF